MTQGLRHHRDRPPSDAAADRSDGLDSAAPPVVSVAVVALWRRGTGGPEVLPTRRPQAVHLGRMWELPGGKIEPGEQPDQAACRETREETGIAISTVQPVAVHRHRYPDRVVELHGFLAAVDEPTLQAAAGTLAGIEYRWVSMHALAEAGLPPANGPITERIVEALQAACG